MTTPTKPWRPPQEVGDRSPDIAKAKAELRKFSYGKGLDTSDTYTAEFGTALKTFAERRNAEIAKGTKPKPVVNTDGVLDWAAKVQLRILPQQNVPAPPPPPKRRHAALVYRGTGGVINEDYVYHVAFQSDLEVIYLDYPASMGGLPPGAAGQPSANDAIRIGVESGARWIEQNPTRTFVLGGYSLGEIVVAELLRLLFTPGGRLYQYRGNYVCSYHIGPPARPAGAAFWGGTAAPGVGISSIRMTPAIQAAVGARACWLCDPDDMYGSIPIPIPGGTGDIMETVYDMVTDLALSDFINTMGAMLPHLLEIAQDAGIFGMIGLGNVGPATSPGGGGLLGGLLGGAGQSGGLGGLLGGGGMLGGLLGGGAALLTPATIMAAPMAVIPMLLPVMMSALPGLIAGMGGPGAGGNLTGPAAAAQAAILGMKFMFTGTRPHIEYHIREVWPGQTYFGLAVQHVRDWSGRTPVR